MTELVNLDDMSLPIFSNNVVRDIYKDQFTDNVMVDFYKKRNKKRITFQVTEKCNLACTYCFQCNKRKNAMTFETSKSLLDSLADSEYFENADGVIIDFIGGEAFLETELVDKVCSYFIDLMKTINYTGEIRFGICSNGTLYFTKKVQDFILKYKDYLHISFSIDGCKESHDMCRIFPDGSGSYDLVSKAFLHYRKTFDHTSNVKLTVSPENVKYFYDSILSMINMGITILQFGLTFEEGWTVEHAKVYYQQLKKVADYIIDNDLEESVVIPQFVDPIKKSNSEENWCSADCGNSISVDTEGKIFTCIRFTQSSLANQKSLPIGSIDDGIGYTEEHSTNLSNIQCLNKRMVSNDKCYNCPISNSCGWCCAYSYEKYGTLNKRTTFTCKMQAALSLVNAYFLNKYAEKKQLTDIEYAFKRTKVNCPYDWASEIINDQEYDMLIKLSHENRRKTNL